MITTPTVLVLGAGASIPYGFPSGRDLVKHICSTLSSFPTKFSKTLNDCGFENQALSEFRLELLNSMQPSVDLFLENRPEFYDIGKACIAAALIPFESADKLQRHFQKIEWYEYLFHNINSKKESFHENQLVILTYNYDRSLEYFLTLALKHSYGLQYEEAASLLIASVPIIHLYGSLGSLPNFGDKTREYSSKTNPKEIMMCASQIRIVSEIELQPDLIRYITNFLSNSSHICFLGCGYHNVNIELIFKEFWKDDNFKFKRFYGSCYGLGDGEKAKIKPLLKANHLDLGDKDTDCLNFLKNSNALIA